MGVRCASGEGSINREGRHEAHSWDRIWTMRRGPVAGDPAEEIKAKNQVTKSVPTANAAKTGLVMPGAAAMKLSTGDWDFRSYSDAWLPSWEQLRSKLVATHRAFEFRVPKGRRFAIPERPRFGWKEQQQPAKVTKYARERGAVSCEGGSCYDRTWFRYCPCACA
jgi:hypothetical protein